MSTTGAAVETVTPLLDKDGQWRVSGFFIKQPATADSAPNAPDLLAVYYAPRKIGVHVLV